MMKSIRLLIFFLLFPLAFSSVALERHFPSTGIYGEFMIRDYPDIMIDGKAQRLSPGARIWNTEQRTQTPNSLGSQTYRVIYTIDRLNAINNVWILRPEELKQKMLSQYRK